MIHRRGFLALAGAGLLGPALTGRWPRAVPPRLRIGLQLYTVRALMARDPDATLARVAAIGYEEVEFAGYLGHRPEDLARALDRHGLAAPSAQVPLAAVERGWSAALDDACTLGHRYVVVAWLPAAGRRTLDDYRVLADQLDRAGEIARTRGIRLAYHNHDFECTPVQGTVPFDLLLERTDPALVRFELDLYWIVKAGRDPLAYFARYPGRFPLLHVKDAGPPPGRAMADVGRGTIDFAGIFARRHQAGVEHAFVEHDDPPDPIASIRASYEAMQRLLR